MSLHPAEDRVAPADANAAVASVEASAVAANGVAGDARSGHGDFRTEDATPAAKATPAGPTAPFESLVQAAQAGIKKGQTPSQIKAGLLARGADPLTTETAYRTARRRLFDSNRQFGAKLAAIAVAVLCGGTLLFVPLGWTAPLVVVLLCGLLLMGVATLVWLTGLGADEP